MTDKQSGGPIAATLIPGDGIGPEIVDAVVKVLEALGAPFVWDVQQGGLAGITAEGTPCRRPRWTVFTGPNWR